MMEDFEHLRALAPVQVQAVDEVADQEDEVADQEDEVADQEVEELGRGFLDHWTEILGDLQVVKRDPLVQDRTSLVWNE